MSEDALLLAETNHRVNNEVASAIAAMRLVGNARNQSARWGLLSKAIDRLEAFGTVHRQISMHACGTMDLGAELDRMCEALAASRSGLNGATLDLRAPKVVVDAETGRRMLMIANELVTNAIRYAIDGRAGRLSVGVRREGHVVILTVIDDGPGIDPDAGSRGTGMGTPLIAELVRRGRGHLRRESGPEGTRVRVALPFDPEAMERARVV